MTDDVVSLLPHSSPLQPQPLLQPLRVLSLPAQLGVAGANELHALHHAVYAGLGHCSGDLAGDESELLFSSHPAALQPELTQFAFRQLGDQTVSSLASPKHPNTSLPSSQN